MQDQELRERFAEWAGPLQAARPPAVSVIRARARRRLARRAGAGGAALTVAGVIAGLVIAGVPGRPGPAQPAGPAGVTPPGQPYLVTIVGREAVVVDEATGAVTGTVAVPARGYSLNWAAAEPGDREFVLAAEGDGRTAAIRYYVLRLDAAGRPAPLRPVPGAPRMTAQIYGLAVSADGAVAVAVQPLVPGQPGPQGVWVFRLADPRAARHWTGAWVSGPLSWAGTTLGFGWQDAVPDDRSGLRVLSATGPADGPAPSLLGSSRLAVRGQAAGQSGQLTADGSRVVALGDTRRRVVLKEFSAASGRLLLSVPLAPESARNGAAYCGVLWSSASGRAVLAQCGDVQEWVRNGRVTRVHLPTTVRASMVGGANTFAW
jgi:hypothetical protein